MVLRLGTWFGTPEGHLLAAAVESGLPYPYRQYSQLFVMALTRAAELQAAQQKDKARSYAVVAVGAVALALAALMGRNG